MEVKEFIFIGLILVSFFLFIGNVSAAAPGIDPVTQVLYYTFNNNPAVGENATFVYDYSGTQFFENQSFENNTFGNFTGHIGNNAIVLNATYCSNCGYYGDGAFNFTGREKPMRITYPNDSSLSLSKNFTLSVWVKPYDTGSSITMGILAQEQGGGFTNSPFDFNIQADEKPAANFYFNTTDLVSTRCNTPIFQQNNWSWFVVRGNGTAITSFMNGVQCNVSNIPANVNFVNNGRDIFVGTQKTGQNPIRGLNGTIDDLILWNNYSLSDSQIASYYNSYINTLECTNLPNSTALSLGCSTIQQTSTNWSNLITNFTGSVSVYQSLNIINNSYILFNGTNSFAVTDTYSPIVNISDSLFSWSSGSSSLSIINILGGGSLFIKNSTITNLYQLFTGTQVSRIEISDSVIKDGYQGLAWFNSPNISINRVNFSNYSNNYEMIKIKIFTNSSELRISNSTFYNALGTCLFVYPYPGYTVNNMKITNNNIENCTGGHGIAYPDNNGAYIGYNTIVNTSGYAIDSYNKNTGCTNLLVERNNVSKNGNGIIFSCGTTATGNSYNTTSRWNRIINQTTGYAVYFRNIINGTSENDFVSGGNPIRCLGIVDWNNKIRVENLTCLDLPQNGVVIAQSTEAYLINLNLTNVSSDFVFTNSLNITIKNSLTDYSDLYGISITNSTNITFYNVLGKYFTISYSPQSIINFTETYITLATSNQNYTNLNISGSSSLSYLTSNRSILGSVIVSNNFGLNTSFNASYGQIIYLDNFNLTEQINRPYSPLSFISSTNVRKVINNNLTQSITTPVLINIDSCDSVGNIQDVAGTSRQLFQKGSYTCSNNVVTLTSVVVEPGAGTELSIEYSCSAFTTTGYRLIMIFASLMIVLVVGMLIYSKGIDGFTIEQIVMLGVVLIVVVVMWLAAGQNLGASCPVS